MTALPRRAFLGAELPADHLAFTAEGIRIAGVVENSMAARAGLRAGDLLLALADQPLHDLPALSHALRVAGAQVRVPVVYERAGVWHTVDVDVVEMPREAGASYGDLPVAGARLRTIATHAESPRAIVVVVQGIACESIDHGLDRDAPLAALVDGWARAGYDTLRFDKRGIGDSEGAPCRSGDFHTELADAREVVGYARRLGLPIILFGHSVGGIIAAQLARESLAGIMVYGTPVMRWLDCLLDSVERQLVLRDASTDEIRTQRAAIEQLATAGDLNGRSAAYHAQLHALDLEAAWRSVEVPVLVLRGEHDWVVSADDQARIAELARGDVTIADLPGLDHLFGWHQDRAASLAEYGVGRADAARVAATVAWLDRVIR
jgi:alpha-beta hydrolase superfamily lysophospholipase